MPHMIKRKEGHIAVISSISGKFGVPIAHRIRGNEACIARFL